MTTTIEAEELLTYEEWVNKTAAIKTEAHREKRRVYGRAYYAAHHVELTKKRKVYLAAHHEQSRKTKQKYRLAHRQPMTLERWADWTAAGTEDPYRHYRNSEDRETVQIRLGRRVA